MKNELNDFKSLNKVHDSSVLMYWIDRKTTKQKKFDLPDDEVEIAPDVEQSEEVDRIMQLREQLQSIVNQLTPENFNVRLNELKSFIRIESPRYVITEIVDVIAEKAIAEPNFLDTYAMMCRELDFYCTVVEPMNVAKKSSFKMKLTSQCQTDFERCSTEYLKGVSSATQEMVDDDMLHDGDSEDRRTSLMEKQSRIRKRAYGIARFMGELFEIGFIPLKIVQKFNLLRFEI